jgi:uncharacterized protein (TIGR00251 family)
MSGWYRFDADRNILCISVHVQPNARTTAISGMHGEALKIRIAGPPQDQRANAILIDFIAKMLDVPASRVRLARGLRSRSKLIEVSAPGAAALTSLRDWAA